MIKPTNQLAFDSSQIFLDALLRRGNKNRGVPLHIGSRRFLSLIPPPGECRAGEINHQNTLLLSFRIIKLPASAIQGVRTDTMAAGSETKDGEQYVELPIKTVEEALKDLGS